MKQIILINSDKFALVDDDKFEELNKYRWRLSHFGYVVRDRQVNENKNIPSIILMHRQIMNVINSGRKVCVDHINHIKNDNCIINLRICNNTENSRNQLVSARKNNNTTSVFKGVSFDKKNKVWMSVIGFNNSYINIGRFVSEEIAALAYDQMARHLYGEFAEPNFKDKFESIININSVLNRKLNTTSKFNGVSYRNSYKMWVSQIQHNKQKVHLGYHENEIDAARAYDNYVIENKLNMKMYKLNFKQVGGD